MGSAAVAAGLAKTAAIGERIWRRGVEKVLAFRTTWLEENCDTVDRLLRAVAAAAAWCDEPANLTALAALPARAEYVDQPVAVIERALAGAIVPRACEAPLPFPDFMLFAREATGFPWRSQALWIYSQLVRWRMLDASPANEAAAAAVFRSDVYRRALAGSAAAMPGASMKVEGALAAPLAVGAHGGALTPGPDRFFDGRVFDPSGSTNILRRSAGAEILHWNTNQVAR